MEIKNFTELEDKLFHKGLPKEMAAEVQAAVDAGQTDFSKEHMTTVDKDQLGFRVHFRYDTETEMVYLNRMTAAIFNSPDFSGMREHTFNDRQLITAMEAYRLLKHGELVAVNKNLYNKAGEQYNAWISLNLNGTKDENGNFPVKSYHQNYYGDEPYAIREVLAKLQTAVKEFEQTASLDTLEKLVKKAFLPEVTIMHEGREQKGYLSIDPGNAGARLFDKDLNLVESYSRPRPEQKQSQAQQKAEHTDAGQDDLKKKSWNQNQGSNQRVTWNKQQKSKGQSYKQG